MYALPSSAAEADLLPLLLVSAFMHKDLCLRKANWEQILPGAPRGVAAEGKGLTFEAINDILVSNAQPRSTEGRNHACLPCCNNSEQSEKYDIPPVLSLTKRRRRPPWRKGPRPNVCILFIPTSVSQRSSSPHVACKGPFLAAWGTTHDLFHFLTAADEKTSK